MKIIKQGKLPTAQMKCEYCGCEFEFTMEDVSYTSFYYGYFIYCPFCRKRTSLTEEQEQKLNL